MITMTMIERRMTTIGFCQCTQGSSPTRNNTVGGIYIHRGTRISSCGGTCRGIDSAGVGFSWFSS